MIPFPSESPQRTRQLAKGPHSEIENKALAILRSQETLAQDGIGGPDGRMPGHGNLTTRREDPDHAIASRVLRFLQKSRQALARIQVRLISTKRKRSS